jgi:exodeoxyribonuclease V
MISKKDFYIEFVAFFGHQPTEDQSLLIRKLIEFIADPKKYSLFLLSGYAGTGKTSILGSLVQLLTHIQIKTRLLAPTGRAAKVLSLKSNKQALTIHKQIYRKQAGEGDAIQLALSPNLYKNTLFIVDEASMIGDYTANSDRSISSRNLLDDLFEYVFSGEGCKLILLGDEGQLPPVGSDFSPALNETYLSHHYPLLKITSHQLKEVLRQQYNSSILENATALRNWDSSLYPKFKLQKRGDLIRINGSELQEHLESSNSNYGQEETIVVTRSNKQANLYNQQIRNRILWYEEQLCSGDCLMVVKNNYFWLEEKSPAGFIANGELIRLKRLLKYEEIYGFQFARCLITFVDYEEIEEKEVLFFVESLTVDAPSISRERLRELFFEIEKDYLHERNKKKRYDRILKNPYFNALQVKYAYAITCHKSQGGQWAAVFIDQGYINDEMLTQDYYRWLYTALTRATQKVYLVNFSDEFFENAEE